VPLRNAIGKRDERQRRRQGEPDPRRQSAEPTGSAQPERHAHLAAGRPRQELAERDQVGVAAIVQPAAPLDKLAAEIAQMRDRPAERREAKPDKCSQDLQRRAFGRRAGCGLVRYGATCWRRTSRRFMAM
jgi:hypothetical protein